MLTQDESASFLPGEIPWETPANWWEARSPLQKGLAIGIPVVLVLGLAVAFWPSSRKKTPGAKPVQASTEIPDSQPAPEEKAEEKRVAAADVSGPNPMPVLQGTPLSKSQELRRKVEELPLRPRLQQTFNKNPPRSPERRNEVWANSPI